MSPEQRAIFDRWLEAELDDLPPRLRDLLEEAPLIVEDHPGPELLRELGLEGAPDELCGLHSGASILERSVIEGVEWPETIHLFREGIVAEAGGFQRGADAVRREIRITLLHEIGHHFGLDEDDLRELGYG